MRATILLRYLFSTLLVLASTQAHAKLLGTDVGGTGQDFSASNGVITVSSGVMSATATLGTSYITNDAIDTDKINAADAPADGECVIVLSAASKTFKYDTCATGSSNWTDSGTNGVLSAAETDDEVVIGASATQGAKLAVKGDADEVQFRIVVNATQTTNSFELRNSGNTTTLASISGLGNGFFETLSTRNREASDAGNYIYIASDTSDTGTAFAGVTGALSLGDIIESGSDKWCFYDATPTKLFCIPAASATSTYALFASATSGEPAFRAIVAGDLPIVTTAKGGLGADVSGVTGMVGLSAGVVVDVDTIGELETALASENVFTQSEAAGNFDFTISQTECITLMGSSITCHNAPNGCTNDGVTYTSNGPGFYSFSFPDAATRYGAFYFKTPANMTGTTAILKIGWFDDVTCNGVVVWTVDGDSFAHDGNWWNGGLAGTLITTNSASCTAVTDIQITTTAAFTHSMSPDEFAVLELARTGASGSDTNTGAANIAFLEFCYEVDNINSGE